MAAQPTPRCLTTRRRGTRTPIRARRLAPWPSRLPNGGVALGATKAVLRRMTGRSWVSGGSTGRKDRPQPRVDLARQGSSPLGWRSRPGSHRADHRAPYERPCKRTVNTSILRTDPCGIDPCEIDPARPAPARSAPATPGRPRTKRASLRRSGGAFRHLTRARLDASDAVTLAPAASPRAHLLRAVRGTTGPLRATTGLPPFCARLCKHPGLLLTSYGNVQVHRGWHPARP